MKRFEFELDTCVSADRSLRASRRELVLGGVAGFIGLAGFAFPNFSHAMGVQPALLDLGINARTMSAPVTVSNSFSDPLAVEMRVQEVRFPNEPDGTLEYLQTDDLLITPPTAVIAPGRNQSFRVLYIGTPTVETSRHFVITVAQLAVTLPEGVNTVQLLYNFKVIVSVGVPAGKAVLEVRSATIRQDPLPQATNSTNEPAKLSPPYIEAIIANISKSHGYLADHRLRVSQFNAEGRRIFQTTLTQDVVRQQVGLGLVAGLQVRRVKIPIEALSASGSVTVEVLGDAPRR